MSDTLELGTLKFQNFYSYGNQLAEIDFSRPGTHAIIGEDRDNNTRNGAGKSTIPEAVIFAIYGMSMSGISIGDMVNNINEKNMQVQLPFKKNGMNYMIVRGKKGAGSAYVKFYESNKKITKADEVTKATSALTNAYILEIVGVSFAVAIYSLIYSADNKSFFDLPTTTGKKSEGTQNGVIEELFELTDLANRATNIKEQTKETTAALTLEKASIETQEEQKTGQRITLESACSRQLAWSVEHDTTVKSHETNLKVWEESQKTKKASFEQDKKDWLIKNQATIKQAESDIVKWDTNLKTSEAEFETVKLNWETEKQEKINKYTSLISAEEDVRLANLEEIQSRASEYKTQSYANIKKVTDELDKIDGLDFEKEAEIFLNITQAEADIIALKATSSNFTSSMDDVKTKKEELAKLIESFEASTCPTCEQTYEDAKKRIPELKIELKTEDEKYTKIVAALKELVTKIQTSTTELEDLKAKLSIENYTELLPIFNSKDALEDKVQTLRTAPNPCIQEIETEKNRINQYIAVLESTQNTVNPHTEFSNTDTNPYLSILEAAKNETNPYVKLGEEINPHVAILDATKNENNPYDIVVVEAQKAVDEKIDYTNINNLDKLLKHQKFLYKLLTNKNSFIRKTLLNKHIPYLNSRIAGYIDDLGMPHTVEFTHDLSTKISKYKKELNFGNLSKGQRARVDFAVSLAFRDVLSNIYGSINVMIVDEVLDIGLDSNGAAAAVKILKQKAKNDELSIFVITHRSEFEGTFDNTVNVILEDNFSRIEQG
jgi:DNA repair exonuclease SbcCD ATPase subunit